MPSGQTSPQSRKIVWVSPLILDLHLHKTSQIEMLQALAERGHRVSLLASYSSRRISIGSAKLRTISIPMRHVPMFSTSAYVLSLCLYLPLFLLRMKPDFVIVEPNPTVLSLFPTLLFPKSVRPKIVLDIRSTPVGVVGVGGYLKTLFFNISLRIAENSFQGITIITSLMKKEVCERYGVDPKSIGVWTSGVSTVTFKPEVYSRIEMKKQFGLGDNFVVFYHGVFGKKRGIIETIRAIGILKHRYPDLVLFLLGRSPRKASARDGYLESIVHELDIQNMVVVHDSVGYTEVPKYIAMCDVGIVPLPDLPEWRYQCPLNLLEYLSMKKVVIATDIPANREILGESRCGIYASSADPQDISDAIAYAYKNRDLLKEWSVSCRNIIDQKYSWTKVAQEFETYLLQL